MNEGIKPLKLGMFSPNFHKMNNNNSLNLGGEWHERDDANPSSLEPFQEYEYANG